MDAIYGLAKDFLFKQAVTFVLEKKVLLPDEYKRLSKESQAMAFTVSGYTSLEIIQGFLDYLAVSMMEGQTQEQFRQNVNHFLEDKGYKGMNPYRADVIFSTNVHTAFNVGHYKSMEAAKGYRPYWQYKIVGDGRERDSHLAMADRVYAADDPIWDLWYPPNGYRCRCMVISLTKKQVENRKLIVETKAPYFVDYETGEISMDKPDKGFSNNPAKVKLQPDVTKLSKPLQKIYKDLVASGK